MTSTVTMTGLLRVEAPGVKMERDGITNEDTKVSGTGYMRVYQRARPRITALRCVHVSRKGEPFRDRAIIWRAGSCKVGFSLDGSDTKCEKNVFKRRVTQKT